MGLRNEIIDVVNTDVGHIFTWNLVDRNTRLGVDITGITDASAKLCSPGSSTALETASVVITATNPGVLTFTSPAGFFDQAAGRYEIEVSITDGATTKTVYRRLNVRIRTAA